MKSAEIMNEIRSSIARNLLNLVDLALVYPGLKVTVYIDNGMEGLMIRFDDGTMKFIYPELSSLIELEKIIEKIKEGIKDGTWNPGAEKSLQSSSGTTPDEQNAG